MRITEHLYKYMHDSNQSISPESEKSEEEKVQPKRLDSINRRAGARKFTLPHRLE